MMSRFLPNGTLLLFVLSLPGITGCSPGSSGAGQSSGQGAGVLFVDEFDGAKLAEHWFPSEPAAIDVADSALTIRDDGRRNTVTLGFWSFASTGVRVVIRAAPPNDATTCQHGVPILTPMFLLLDATTAETLAGVMLLPCSKASPTTFRYWIGDPSIQFFEEHMPGGTVTGRFMEFAFRVDAAGTATWSRDGVDKFVAPFGESRGLRLRLSSGHGAPALPMRFDSVVVRRDS